MNLDSNFVEAPMDELVEVNGGDTNQFAKALTGTLLLAGGVVVMAVPGCAGAGASMAVLGITGIASSAK